jgi:hypothetical protein
MSAKELLDRFMASAKPGVPLDWRKWQKEIVAEHEKAPNERDRVLCLDLHRALLNAVERQIKPADLEELKKLRDQEYILLLLQEAMIESRCLPLQPARFATGE